MSTIQNYGTTLADADIGELLASIKAIMAEKPLTRAGIDRREQLGNNQAQPLVSPHGADRNAAQEASSRASKKVSKPSSTIALQNPKHDAVLAELLAPAEGKGDSTVRTTKQRLERLVAGEGGVGLRSAPDKTPAQAEMLSASDALGELAAGLAALPAGAELQAADQSRVADQVGVVSAPTNWNAAAPAQSLALAGAAAVALSAQLTGQAHWAASTIEPDVASATASVQDVVAAAGPVTQSPVDSQPESIAAVDIFDDAIATMLRPLLREWLDAHMPRLVVRALREELAEPTPSQAA